MGRRLPLLSEAGQFVRCGPGNSPTGVPCPSCGDPIVYNGNYFCTICEWAMPDTWGGTKKVLPYLEGLIRKRQEAGQDTFREEFYLPNGHPLKKRGDT